MSRVSNPIIEGTYQLVSMRLNKCAAGGITPGGVE